MSQRYPGGLITKSPVTPTSNSAPGVWTMEQALQYIKAGTWPSPTPPSDPFFEYVTMLLPTDGTNGAQNNSFVDSSLNNFSLTRNGNVTQGTFTPFGSNWSNHFDGSGDTLTIAQNAANDFGTGDFCVEAWVFPWQAGYIVLQRPGTGFSSGNWYIYGGNGDNAGAWNTRVGSNSDLVMRGVIPPNAWTHVCVTRSGNQGRFFSNGVLTGTATFASSDSLGGATTSIGDIASGTQNPFGGYISNVRIVKGSIPALYQTSSTTIGATIFTPPTTPLSNVSGCGLLTCQSNRFIDNSSNNFSITRNGDVRVERFSPFNPTASYSAATNGGGGFFDATNDTLASQVSSNLTPGTGAFQIDFWMYPTALPGNYAGPFGTNNAGIFLGFRAGAYLDFVNNIDTAGAIRAPYPRLFEWHHIVLVRNSSNVRSYYIDGVRIGTLNNSVNFDQTQVYLGSYSPTFGGWPGYLSNFRYIIGSNIIDPNSATIPVPTAPNEIASNTQLFVNFTNAGIIDNAMMNPCETVGSAQLSTSAFKFGTSSLYTGTSGSNCLTFPSGPTTRFYTGDFTVEGWFRPTASGNERTFFIQGVNTTGGIAFFVGTGGARFRANGQTDLAWGGSISDSTFTHVAFVRYGTTRYIFVNGTQVASDSLSFNNNDDTTLEIGAPAKNAQDAFRYYGYIDDLRVSRFARYTANFTPPSTAFSTL